MMIDGKNPFAVMDAIDSNQNALVLLEALRQRLKAELKEEKKVKRQKGYFMEGLRKEIIVDEIKGVDMDLAKQIAALGNKDEMVATIDKRISTLKRELDEGERALRLLLEQEEQTFTSADEIVRRYLHIMGRIKENYREQIENIRLNEVFENELAEVTRIGTIDHPQTLAKMIEGGRASGNRITRNKILQDEIIRLLDEAKALRERAADTEARFEHETEEITGIKRRLGKLFAPLLSALGIKKEEKEGELRLKQA